jgi:hypothetical protein
MNIGFTLCQLLARWTLNVALFGRLSLPIWFKHVLCVKGSLYVLMLRARKCHAFTGWDEFLKKAKGRDKLQVGCDASCILSYTKFGYFQCRPCRMKPAINLCIISRNGEYRGRILI